MSSTSLSATDLCPRDRYSRSTRRRTAMTGSRDCACRNPHLANRGRDLLHGRDGLVSLPGFARRRYPAEPAALPAGGVLASSLIWAGPMASRAALAQLWIVS